MSPIRHPAVIFERPNPLAALCDEIASAARSILQRSSEAELQRLSCSFSAGVLTLGGIVSCESLRQAAEEAVADVPGVIEVENHIEVDRRETALCLDQTLCDAFATVRAAS